MSELIFVYGALRKGASNAWRMKDAAWLGSATVPGTLLAIDWYPGLILEGQDQIKGEVYQISDELLTELDLFEGIGADQRPGEYHRVRASVTLISGPREVWLYEWLKGTEGYEQVSSSDWLSHSSS